MKYILETRKNYGFFYLNKNAWKCLVLFMRYEMCCIQTLRHSYKTVLYFVLIDNTTFLNIVYRSYHLGCTYPFILLYTWYIIIVHVNQKLQMPRCTTGIIEMSTVWDYFSVFQFAILSCYLYNKINEIHGFRLLHMYEKKRKL